MTAWPSVYGTTALVTATLVTTAETVVAQVPVTTDGAAAIFLLATAAVTPGTNATGISLRMRLDSVTGTQVAIASTPAVTAAATAILMLAGQVPGQEIAGRLIVFTLQQVAASANATVISTGLFAFPQF